MKKNGWAVGVIGAIGTAAFIPAFKLTSVANVALIYAVAPLIAATLAWVFIGEKLSAKTAIGTVAAFVGVLVIVSGSIGEVYLQGDLLALVMTAAMATIMVIYRKYPETPGAGPSVMQSVFLIPPALILGTPFSTSPAEIGILAAFGLLFAIASVTLAEGSKRVSSGQAALIGALETPLAPLLAFLILSEAPNATTFLGGVIVLLAVLFSMTQKST